MKKKKKSRSDLSRSVGRTTSSNRDVGAEVEMHAMEAQALSVSLSLSDVKRWNVLEVKKKIKRRGGSVSCVEEKNKKKKKRNEMWMKMK